MNLPDMIHAVQFFHATTPFKKLLPARSTIGVGSFIRERAREDSNFKPSDP